MNILFIDTTNKDEVIVGLELDSKSHEIKSKSVKSKKEVTLDLVDSILKKYKLDPKELTNIKVNPGPGSFTGTRVGVSVANALGFALKIPVNGKKVGEAVEPVYN